MRAPISLSLVALFGWISLAPSTALAGPRVRIAILSDSAWVLEPYDAVVREEIHALLDGEFEIEFPNDANVHAESSTARAGELLDSLLARSDVDMIVALGPRSTQVLARHPNLEKPCFGSTVIERELQGFPITPKGSSGRRNLTYLVDDLPLAEKLMEFQRLVELDRVAILLDPEVAESIPAIDVEVDAFAERTELRVEPVAIEPPLESVLEQLPPEIDGVLVGPLLAHSEGAVRDFAQGLIDRRLPSFAIVSSREVELGLLATVAPSSGLRRIARRLALQIQDTLLGTPPEDLLVGREIQRELTINMATARSIGVPLRYDVMERAILLNPDARIGARSLTLKQSVRESIDANLDLVSQDRVVAAGREDILIALARLLPQASASVGVGWNDSDLSNRTRIPSAGASGQLVLFDEALLGNLSIARYGQEGVEAAREQIRQDIVQGTGTAFLEVLRASTALRIRRDNLRVTRANLELAETRRRIGTAAAGEVYRWQSEEAIALRDLIFARADDRNSRIALNRLLNRPLEEEFEALSIGIDDLAFTLSDERLQPYFEMPALSVHLRDFLVRVGLQQAPELDVIDAQVRAQRRLLASRNRTFFLPRVAASGSVDRVFEQEISRNEIPDSTQWSAGVEASIPLAEGGARIAERRQAREDLARLRIDRRGLAQQVEERIRFAANRAAASFVAIDLNRRAADAGERRLELVTEAYSRGAVDILDLLDAQNNAFTARQQAANALYDHLIDLLELQRSAGDLEILESSVERAARIEEMQRYLEERAPDAIRLLSPATPGTKPQPEEAP